MRRSGQTFRTIAHAIIAASANRNYKVLLMFVSASNADYAYRMAQAMTLPIRDFTTISPVNRRVSFANGSRIDFRPLDETPSKGLKYQNITVDNSIEDLPSWWGSFIASALDPHRES